MRIFENENSVGMDQEEIIQELPERLKEKARLELNETDENKQEAIEQLRDHEIVRETSKIMSACVNSCFLLKFLRARKFDVQKAAELYKNYYDKRSLLCGFDRLQDSSTFKQGITDLAKNYGDFIAVLDEPDSCGRKIIICRENVFQTNVGADENRPYTLWFFILLEWMLEVNPTMQINGVVVLSDMTSFSYSHLRWIMTHPRALQERITSIQDAVPMRIKAIRVANEPYVFTMVYTLVAPFLKAKLRDRLKTVSNRYDEIYKLLGRSKSNSQSTLPKTLGGKLNFEQMTKKTTDDIVNFYLEKGKLF